MSNLSLEVDKIRDYMRRGMPEGAEPVIHSIGVLFKRIDELEWALAPFAQRANVDNENKPLIYVYHKDCKTAYTTLSKRVAQSLQPPPEEYLPAEV